jgi:PKD repeat protein
MYTSNIYCRFYNAVSSGSAPLITCFNCLSIGANSYSYNCGDGHTITRRWAWKQYNNAGNYSPQLTVFNSSNNTTCNSTVNVDVGIEELAAMNAIILSPNPATNEFMIKSRVLGTERIENVEIYDFIGTKNS